MTQVSTGSTTTTGRRILQRQVLPGDKDTDVLALYIDPDPAVLDADKYAIGGNRTAKDLNAAQLRQSTSAGDTVHPDQITGRHTLRLERGEELSFGTYFNAFPAGYWRRWTLVTDVRLTIALTGAGATVTVYRSIANGRSQRVDTAGTGADAKGEFTFDLSLKPFVDGGWYWYDVVAGEEPVDVEGVWDAEVPDGRLEPGSLTIAITTMNRPNYCGKLLAQMGNDPGVQSLLDEVLVMEQGSQKVVDSPQFPGARAALGDKLRVIEQGNIGGSGGYARGQYETLRKGAATYVMMMDDDVVCEPESIIRAVTFADLAKRPTIVGGHMFSIYDRSVLHSFGEIVQRRKFWWRSPSTVMNDWDFSVRNLRSARWLHRRIDVDYNGWFMCLVPMQTLREVGLSLPLFIKWDDSEFGLRAGEAGYPTVTLPGVAVWHVPWTEKDDTLDWQAYFHQRNRLVSGLLHSPYERGGRLVLESLENHTKRLMSMQYSTGEIILLALNDVLDGPELMHRDILTRLGEIRELRAGYPDGPAEGELDDYPTPRLKKPPRRGRGVPMPGSTYGKVKMAVVGLARQVLPTRALSDDHPEGIVPHVDQRWWRLAHFDSAIVSSADGMNASWYRRDPAQFRDQVSRSAALHARLYREWPELAKRYREALPEITSPEAWKPTFAGLEDGKEW